MDLPAANADRADEFAVFVERVATAEDHHSVVVRVLDAIERLARLGRLAEVFGRHLVTRRRVGLVARDIDRAEPRPVHSAVDDEGSLLVRHGNDHRVVDLVRTGFGRVGQFLRSIESDRIHHYPFAVSPRTHIAFWSWIEIETAATYHHRDRFR